MSEVIATVKKNVRVTDKRVSIYFDLIQVFEDHDADNLYECLGEDPAFDQAMAELETKRPR